MRAANGGPGVGVAGDQLEAGVGEQLQGNHRPKRSAQLRGRGDRRGCIGEADDAHRPVPHRRHQPQPNAGDDGQRALGPGQQAAEVVAGVVLRHAGQAAQDRPSTRTASNPSSWERIGPWRTTFTPPALVATIPPIVAESRAPRSTPTSQPAARAAACTTRQRRAGSDRYFAGDAIHLLDLVQAQQAHHHLAATRHRPADEPGVTALRHDGRARIGACDQHACDLVGRGWANDRQRLSVEPARPIGLVGGAKAGIGDAVVLADDLAERVDERVGGHGRILTARGLRSDRRTGGEPMMDDRPERQPLPSEDGGDLVDEPASGETEDYLVASAEGVPYVPPTERAFAEESDADELEREDDIQPDDGGLPRDGELQADVIEALRASDVPAGERIRVAVSGRRVRVQGEVETIEALDEILGIVGDVPGVDEVVDEVTVTRL